MREPLFLMLRSSYVTDILFCDEGLREIKLLFSCLKDQSLSCSLGHSKYFALVGKDCKGVRDFCEGSEILSSFQNSMTACHRFMSDSKRLILGSEIEDSLLFMVILLDRVLLLPKFQNEW